MLGNCDNLIITPISPTTNQSPQIQKQIVLADDRNTNLMASSSTNVNKADPHPLKCPRCDSSNTKFCYYNNYSLSQPRHFCKACKRYWTRGGTLRNVPVGGGCRKNKRPKRHSDGPPLSAAANPSVQPQINSSSSSHIQNPLFYGLPTNNPLELNFPFSNFRVSSDAAGFDHLHPQINSLGLGFSSGLNNGFKPIQDVINNSISTSSPFSTSANNSSFFLGSSSFSTTSSTMASLLASAQTNITFPSLMPYDDPQIAGPLSKQLKPEGENKLGWNSNPTPNPIDQINSSDPPSYLMWNTNGAWFDPSSMGSSVPSLI